VRRRRHVMMFVQSLHGISHNKMRTEGDALGLLVIAFDKLADKALQWIQSKTMKISRHASIPCGGWRQRSSRGGRARVHVLTAPRMLLHWVQPPARILPRGKG